MEISTKKKSQKKKKNRTEGKSELYTFYFVSRGVSRIIRVGVAQTTDILLLVLSQYDLHYVSEANIISFKYMRVTRAPRATL